jgi:hypothetical protein
MFVKKTRNQRGFSMLYYSEKMITSSGKTHQNALFMLSAGMLPKFIDFISPIEYHVSSC